MVIKNLINKFVKYSKYKSFAYAFFGVVILSGIIGVSVYLKNYNAPLVVGFVADIHAGDQDYRDDGEEAENILIPSNFEKNITKALGEMQDCDIIFSLGDNLNRPSRKNTQKLLDITEKYPFYWTKGNHDKPKHFEELLSDKRYYYVDKKNWRMIVLDNSATFAETEGHEEKGRGFIDKEQLIWLEQNLKTKRNVAIIMHLPMLRRDGLDIREDYSELGEFFLKHKNIKHIFSGHYHVKNLEVERSGIIHHIIPSISLKDKEGSYYKIRLDK